MYRGNCIGSKLSLAIDVGIFSGKKVLKKKNHDDFAVVSNFS